MAPKRTLTEESHPEPGDASGVEAANNPTPAIAGPVAGAKRPRRDELRDTGHNLANLVRNYVNSNPNCGIYQGVKPNERALEIALWTVRDLKHKLTKMILSRERLKYISAVLAGTEHHRTEAVPNFDERTIGLYVHGVRCPRMIRTRKWYLLAMQERVRARALLDPPYTLSYAPTGPSS